MNVVNGIENYNYTSKSILTIGTFDGVHLGHQKIIRSLVTLAKKKKLKANLLTFFPHPRMVLQKDTGIKLIDTIKEKVKKTTIMTTIAFFIFFVLYIYLLKIGVEYESQCFEEYSYNL